MTSIPQPFCVSPCELIYHVPLICRIRIKLSTCLLIKYSLTFCKLGNLYKRLKSNIWIINCLILKLHVIQYFNTACSDVQDLYVQILNKIYCYYFELTNDYCLIAKWKIFLAISWRGTSYHTFWWDDNHICFVLYQHTEYWLLLQPTVQKFCSTLGEHSNQYTMVCGGNLFFLF